MLSRPSLLVAVCASLALAGCVHTVWVKPGASQSEYEQTKAACMIEGAQQVPQDNHTVLLSDGYTTHTSKCKDNRGCVSSSSYSPPQYGTVDNNQGLRDQVYRACLYRNGWQEVQTED